MTAGAILSGFRRRALAPRVAILLVFLALAFRVVVPPGYMPSAPTAGGGMQIVICTGHVPLQLDQSDSHGAPPAKHKSQAACPFAGVGGVATLPPILSPAARPAPFERADAAVIEHQTQGRRLAAAPPPARGPPALPSAA